jgi:heme/copper-type cytochrome/quinol oxidase subunit 3
MEIMGFMQTVIIYFKIQLKLNNKLHGRKVSSLTMNQVTDFLPISSINLITMAHRQAAQFSKLKLVIFLSNTAQTGVMFFFIYCM